MTLKICFSFQLAFPIILHYFIHSYFYISFLMSVWHVLPPHLLKDFNFVFFCYFIEHCYQNLVFYYFISYPKADNDFLRTNFIGLYTFTFIFIQQEHLKAISYINHILKIFAQDKHCFAAYRNFGDTTIILHLGLYFLLIFILQTAFDQQIKFVFFSITVICFGILIEKLIMIVKQILIYYGCFFYFCVQF